MDDEAIMRRLSEVGLALPPPPAVLASYLPVVESGDWAFVSGQVPMREGNLLHPGHLGDRISISDGAEAAGQSALQALSALRASVGNTFEPIRRIVQVTVYVASTPDFEEHPQVANGASDLLEAALGDDGRHSRAAVGVASLPLGSCVEVALIAELMRSA
jgi:enamine deaminase RidA (YjgF/YER057c/UK114 family)